MKFKNYFLILLVFYCCKVEKNECYQQKIKNKCSHFFLQMLKILRFLQCSVVQNNKSKLFCTIDKFFSELLMRLTPGSQIHSHIQNWPTGTIRVDFQRFSIFSQKFVDVHLFVNFHILCSFI